MQLLKCNEPHPLLRIWIPSENIVLAPEMDRVRVLMYSKSPPKIIQFRYFDRRYYDYDEHQSPEDTATLKKCLLMAINDPYTSLLHLVETTLPQPIAEEVTWYMDAKIYTLSEALDKLIAAYQKIMRVDGIVDASKIIEEWVGVEQHTPILVKGSAPPADVGDNEKIKASSLD